MTLIHDPYVESEIDSYKQKIKLREKLQASEKSSDEVTPVKMVKKHTISFSPLNRESANKRIKFSNWTRFSDHVITCNFIN